MSLFIENARLVGRSISSSVLSGADPSEFDPSNPITLFIIQLFIIICFTQGLGWCLKFMNQPKVIAEVIGGIILGPTVLGRIPNFTDSIFPSESIPYLDLVATIGLILFLFVVGLEVDVSTAKRNGRNSALISFAGMALPFALGSAVAVPVYHNFVETETVTFGHFLLFICVSMSITAFPVLCRILTATKLLDTKVGIIVLSAGVGNDVVGWVLLALTLALTGAKSGVTAVYILLCAVAWSILLLWPIRKAFLWLCRRTGSLEHGPTPGVMTIMLLIVFGSAFVTGIIGVHPIFGGFIAGLIIPHEGGFAIAVTERIDDLVSMLFLPIYFVLSGLKTNLGLLNTGKIWGFVIMLCCVAFSSKFIGCAGTAKILGYSYRESGAIGMLMSCKGLVELIVLNVGLQAGIIDEQLFSMMVLVAVVLTFATTPCTLLIYPKRFHVRLSATGEPLEDNATNAAARADFLRASSGGAAGGREYTSRILVVLQKLEHLGATMFITQLLEPAHPVHAEALNSLNSSTNGKTIDSGSSEAGSSDDGSAKSVVHIDALKLVELTGRTFSVMQSAEKDQLLLTDDALQLYKQFGRLRGMDINPHISVISQEGYASAVADYAMELNSELVVIPWTIPAGGPIVTPEPEENGVSSMANNSTPFDNIFAGDGSPMYTHFIRNMYTTTTADVGVFIDRGFGGATVTPPGSGQHIFFPFFGGPDDRLALRMVVQLCHHANVTATVIRIVHEDAPDSASDAGTVHETKPLSEGAQAHQVAFQSNQLTVGGPKLEEQSRVVSETADNIAWTYYTSTGGASSDTALRRIVFTSEDTATPLQFAAQKAEAILQASRGGRMWRPLLVVAGRGRRRAAYNHENELSTILANRGQNPIVGAELRKTVGDPATALILAGGQAGQASFLVFEAGQ
ncbi:K(+)/H(+) antiporter [Apiotrichum porosum]|uniref:K(+)/H(+) antiporter n=1 Tax=Apiotrichum porosum TaxID=105984 RepID=A0A427Y6D5_9TREE|nr:K(+)/H(+) antiporter [Apiotrichum porosum]RSH86649.1 K(+)/H(+) antiporter [Apiotrichum porosum]